MLSRDYANLKQLTNDRRSYFSLLQRDLLLELSFFSQGMSDIGKALHHAAYARDEDVATLLALLEVNPRLLLQRGSVITPGGNEVKGRTIYEFLLGDGDPKLAAKVGEYFKKIENGEQIRIQQYEPYRTHIEGILTQEPYNFTDLFDVILNRSFPSEVKKELDRKDFKNEEEDESELCRVLRKFRKDHAPRVLDEPCMHFNFASLRRALEWLKQQWGNLYTASGNNYDLINLVWRQVIGFILRRLPGVDRCRFARGRDDDRSYKLMYGDGDFPVTLNDDSLDDGLGSRFAIDMGDGGGRVDVRGGWGRPAGGGAACVGQLMSSKNFKLTELMQQHPKPTTAGCVIC